MIYNSTESDGVLIHASSLEFAIFGAVRHTGAAYRERINQHGSRLIGSRLPDNYVVYNTTETWGALLHSSTLTASQRFITYARGIGSKERIGTRGSLQIGSRTIT